MGPPIICYIPQETTSWDRKGKRALGVVPAVRIFLENNALNVNSSADVEVWWSHRRLLMEAINAVDSATAIEPELCGAFGRRNVAKRPLLDKRRFGKATPRQPIWLPFCHER